MTRKHVLALLKSFMAQKDVDLQNAVLLLGGSAALMRLQRFRRSMSDKNAKFRKQKHELNWLCDLLSLENVADIDREESGYFAEIDPADDAVWMICGLTESVQDLLDRFESISDANDEEQGEVAA